MKKIKLLSMALAMLVTTMAFAQKNITVTGVVKDASNGEILPFASIQLKGTMTGGNTDLEGKYSINVPSDGVLIFSSIGFQTLEIPVNGRTLIDLELSPDTQVIEETIVVAFGESTKEAFTGSAAVVKSSDIAKVQSTGATRALEGVVAGVQMTTSSGSIGSSPSIVIRGVSSINAGSSPLYIVDGVPFSGNIENINPSDIESMTVLKDAASNALYGARGANGVIMITTKKAKHGEAVVNFDAKWGWNSKALREYDYITDPGQYYEAHYASLKNYYMANGFTEADAYVKANTNLTGSSRNGGLGYGVFTVPNGQFLIGSNGRLNPEATLGRMYSVYGENYWVIPDNWADEAYRNSLRQEYNLSVSGTSEKASVYASFGYLNNEAIVHGSDQERITARLRADYQAKEWLKIGANAAYTNYNYNYGGNSDEGSSASTGNIFGYVSGMAPIYPMYIRDAKGNIMRDERGDKIYDFGNYANGGLLRPYQTNSNPMQTLMADKSYAEGNSFTGTAFAEVSFLRDFKFTFNVGLGTDEARSISANNPYYGQFAATGGSVSVSHARDLYVNYQQLLSWKRAFGSSHNVSVLLGHEYYKSTDWSLGAYKTGIFSMDNLELNGAITDGQGSTSSSDWYNNEGYFLRAQYDFMNKIFVSGSFRRDASSRFHPDHRWGNFWSVGAGWIINQESWFDATWVDMLKLKMSYGSQGNDNIGSYRYLDTFSVGSFNDDPTVQLGSKGNKNITWETNSNFNIGADFEVLGSKITGSLEYFYRKTSDMLYFFKLPTSSGYGGYYDNVGDMRNSGVELTLNANIITTRDLSWSVYFNATHYRNRILMIPDKNKSSVVEGYEGYSSGDRFYGEGLSLYTFYMKKYAGVDKTNGLPLYWMDITDDKDNVIGREKTSKYTDATNYVCGDPTPDMYGGFGTSLQYKGFDFAISFTYSIGGLAYDSGYASLLEAPAASTGSNYHKDVFKAWSPSNPDSDFPRHYYLDTDVNATSDRFLTDASYLNLQNAQIGYTLPAKYTDRIRVSRVRVYVACDNVWYCSARQGLDPRQSLSGATSSSMNSPVRTVSGGISLTF